ncbi:hypothetical protein C8R43DRAFT_951716 [Mycena crocata]|nr:hypothetical protein C8R43DRAFT_951716 [Mycena crocata]
MVKTTSSGNKHKNRRSKASIDSKTYRPGLDDEEKLRRHRKAQSKYYAGNPNVPVRRLEKAAENREAAKLKKRRWDRPKQKATVPPSVAASQVSGERFSFKHPRAHNSSDMNAAVGTAASPTSEEVMASHALAQLAGGVAAHVLQDDDDAGEHFGRFQVQGRFAEVHWRAGSVDSILEMAKQLSSVDYIRSRAVAYKHAQIPVRRTGLPPAVAPLTRVQEAHLQITGEIGPLTGVQAAQMEVAKLSCPGVFVAATPEDAVKWRTPGTIVTDLWDASDWTKKETGISQWRRRVHRQVQKARLLCETDEGIYELDLEEVDLSTCVAAATVSDFVSHEFRV